LNVPVGIGDIAIPGVGLVETMVCTNQTEGPIKTGSIQLFPNEFVSINTINNSDALTFVWDGATYTNGYGYVASKPSARLVNTTLGYNFINADQIKLKPAITNMTSSSKTYGVTVHFENLDDHTTYQGCVGTTDALASYSSNNLFLLPAIPLASFTPGNYRMIVDLLDGNVVTDTTTKKFYLMKATTTGYTVSTLAGSGSTGAADGTGTAASFHEPYGIAVDASGIVYVGDVWNNLIRKISPVGVVSTLAGQASVTGSTNGTGTDALFYMPSGVALDTTGNLYVADDYNGLIREISPVGVVSTFAGGVFAEPRGIAVDTAGNVYVADTWHYRVCKITSGGVVSTLAGSGSWGSTDGTGTAASFSGVVGVAVDTSGNVYAADQGNQCIRKITSDGVVSTLAGQAGVTGSINSTGSAASFNQPEGVAVDSSGNVYVADSANHMIRIITPGGVVSTLAGSGAQGSTDGPATTASFYTPDAIAVDASNNVYVCDGGGNTIRKITHN
jgi:sugar lactone lactonase YvrE